MDERAGVGWFCCGLAALVIAGPVGAQPLPPLASATGLYSQCLDYLDFINRGSDARLPTGPAASCWASVAVAAASYEAGTAPPTYCPPRSVRGISATITYSATYIDQYERSRDLQSMPDGEAALRTALARAFPCSRR